MIKIRANGLDHRQLNIKIREALDNGETDIEIDGVNGQRYIGAGLRIAAKLKLNGVPGNDLACFMDGPEITVYGNGQDGIGNTMNSGKVIVLGDARDIVGHSMRGGKIFIRGNVGFRVGIHMKSYEEQVPIIVIGGRAGAFLGEYMAGGVLVILGLDSENDVPLADYYLGTGMHGGAIYLRDKSIEKYKLIGQEVAPGKLDAKDKHLLSKIIEEFGKDVEVDVSHIKSSDFTKLIPVSLRPYGRLYAY